MYVYRMDVSGNWNLSVGPISLSQTGNTVTGTVGAGLYSGRLNGTLTKSVLTGTWISSFFPSVHGQLYLQFSPDGRTFSGTAAVAGQTFPVYGNW